VTSLPGLPFGAGKGDPEDLAVWSFRVLDKRQPLGSIGRVHSTTLVGLVANGTHLGPDSIRWSWDRLSCCHVRWDVVSERQDPNLPGHISVLAVHRLAVRFMDGSQRPGDPVTLAAVMRASAKI